MKLSTKPLAAAVSLALISVSAHAALTTPAIGTTAPSSTGLYLSVWDSGSNDSEVVNLSYAYADVSLAAGNLNPNSATSPFTSTVNPSTGTGNVLQLNFGVIPGFSSLFTSSNIGTTNYMVTAAVSGGAGEEAAAVTSATAPVTLYSGLGGLIANVQGESAAWAGDPAANKSGFVTDTTGTSAESIQANSGLRGAGNLIAGQQFGGSVGSSLEFYNLTTFLSGTKGKETNSPYANATGDGFWYLSTSGDLTYNIAAAGGTAPVPLPAAIWLLGSGLLGMAGIGRRRRNAA
jgi:hypothetical protein